MIHNTSINRFSINRGGTAWKMLQAVLIGSVYFFLCRFDFYFRNPQTGLPSIYFPIGFAIAMILLNPPHRWPLIAGFAFLLTSLSSYLIGISLQAALLFSLIRTGEIIFIALLIKSYANLSEYFFSFREGLRFVIIIALSNTVGALLVTLASPSPLQIPFLIAFITNWFADGLGMYLLIPLLYNFRTPPLSFQITNSSASPFFNFTRIIEAVFLVLSVVGSAVFLFLTFQNFFYSWAFRSYLIFPFIIWLGIRFDHRYTSILLLIVCMMAIIGVQLNLGIFVDSSLNSFQELQVVQIYLGVMVFTTHLPMIVSREYRKASQKLLEKENEFRLMFNESPLGMFQFRPGDKNAMVNQAMAKIFGYASVDEIYNPPVDLPEQFYKDQKAFVDFLLACARQEGWVYEETTAFTKDKNQIICKVSVHRVSNPDGTLSYLEGFVEDITGLKKQVMLQTARGRLLEMSHYSSLDELLTAILDEAEELSDSRVGFFHFLDSDQVTLTLCTWSTRTARDYCKAEGKGTHYAVSKAGVWVDCIEQRMPVIHNDYASLPHRKGLPEGHAPVFREMVIPVFRDNLIVAIMGVGNKAVNYDQRDVEMVSQLADIAWDITGRIRAEQKLVKSEALLNESQHLAKVGGWEYDPLSGEIIITDVLYEMLGIPSGSSLKADRNLIQFTDIEQYAKIRMAFTACRDQFTPFDIEVKASLKKGKQKWLRIKAQAIVMMDQLEKITGSVLDISEIKEAQAALAENEEQLRLTLDASTDGMWSWYPQDNSAEYSPAYCRMLGYEHSEFPPENGGFQSILHPDDRLLVNKTDQGLVENQYDSFDVEYRLLTKSAEWKWILCRGKAVQRDESGHALRVVGTTVDITERKRMEEMLRQTNSRLEKQAEANRAMQELLVEQATRDALTGLYNRRFMNDSLLRELQRAERDRSEVSVLVLDIDHFKQFNDQFGHDAGDQVLIALSSQLKLNIRESDIACRFGGEEFVVILPGATRSDGLNRAEVLRSEFNNGSYGPIGLHATISVGLAVYPHDGLTVDSLVKNADTAMYFAKNNGRNRVSSYHEKVNQDRLFDEVFSNSDRE
ncbi:MAG: diguanylate cyclase [Chloroflexota bacterium]